MQAVPSVSDIAWFHFDELPSTQDEVRSRMSLVEAKLPSGIRWAPLIGVSAAHQTAGRGRLGSSWLDARGSLMLSIGFLDDLSNKGFPVLVMKAAASAVRSACAGLLGHTDAERLYIRWPNDVMLDGRKLAGTLVETFRIEGSGGLRGTVLGVGVNAASRPPEVPDAAALADYAADIDASAVKRSFLADFGAFMAQPDEASRRYAACLRLPPLVRTPAGAGKPVSWESGAVTIATPDGNVTVNEDEIIGWEG